MSFDFFWGLDKLLGIPSYTHYLIKKTNAHQLNTISIMKSNYCSDKSTTSTLFHVLNTICETNFLSIFDSLFLLFLLVFGAIVRSVGVPSDRVLCVL
mmetsp:Transcript_686/g.1537  ORF Transcript_686/g.1537 Transcript_686/m.1537 type:complete len:97 (-) Transcript_686:823-1113(-)